MAYFANGNYLGEQYLMLFAFFSSKKLPLATLDFI